MATAIIIFIVKIAFVKIIEIFHFIVKIITLHEYFIVVFNSDDIKFIL